MSRTIAHPSAHLFADLALACRIERAECRLITDCAQSIRAQDPLRGVFVATLGGGVAAHVGMEAPFNKMIGMGLGGPLDDAGLATLAAIETEFAARRTPLQAELCTLADSSLARLLSERGYTLVGFENVLGRSLAPAADADPAERLPEGLAISQPRDQDEGEVGAWLDTVVTGFAHPDAVPGGAPHESFPRQAIEQAMTDTSRATGFARYVARLDGVIAGGGSLRQCEGVAQLCGSATLPALRRRGVQTALLSRRLHDAARSGCDIAVITTQPGSKSQQNAQRNGFALLYSRAILVRTPR